MVKQKGTRRDLFSSLLTFLTLMTMATGVNSARNVLSGIGYRE